MTHRHLIGLFIFSLFMVTSTCPKLSAADNPFIPKLIDVKIKSSVDGAMQPAKWFAPQLLAENETLPKPLLVVLHSWSADYRQTSFTPQALKQCAKRNWCLIHPNFRGPNKTPNACGSKLAVADVLDAVAYAKSKANIDPKRIYLFGASGGGHMALMMATRSPKTWAGVSSWVPVTDLTAWHGECKKSKRKYWKDIEGVTGGAPGSSAKTDAIYKERSPLFHLQHARGVRIDLNVGIHDGYTGSIPITHSLFAFNRLADANNAASAKLTDDQIKAMRTGRKVPAALLAKNKSAQGRVKKVLFQRNAGPARLTIFDGGHEGDINAAVHWFSTIKNTK